MKKKAPPSESEAREIYKQFEELVEKYKKREDAEDTQQILEAFELAYNAHKAERRKTGEPYITHPLEVARIVGEELKLDALSISCALLHDVVEDTDFTLEDIREGFGDQAAVIIDGLTKIEELYDDNSNLQAENFKKLLTTINDDIRIIFIKLADRLHNMRTLHGMKENKQLQKAGEVLYVYAPLAHRLGLHKIKIELEDLSFKYRQTHEFQALFRKIHEASQKQIAYINKFKDGLFKCMKRTGVDFRIDLSRRSVYSSWSQMKEKGVSVENIPNLICIRIVFQPKANETEITECYRIYGALTQCFRINVTKDWVNYPRSNGYEALHSEISFAGKWFPLQIRTLRMHDIAEFGYAVEKNYKKESDKPTQLDLWIEKIKHEIQKPFADANEFLEEIRLNLYSSDIYIFTPKNQVRILPKASTVLDFAYEIHTELGHHCIGAFVNQKTQKPYFELSSGDQVKIIAVETQTPSIDWMEFVITPKAKNALKNFFRKTGKDKMLEGKALLNKISRELGVKFTKEEIEKIKDVYNFRSIDEFYYKIGEKSINEEDIIIIYKEELNKKTFDFSRLQFRSKGNNLGGGNNKPVKFDKKSKIILDDSFDVSNFMYGHCCNPLPGDDVIGYKSHNKEIVIHRADCPEAIRLSANSKYPVVKVEWTTHRQETFLTRIKVIGTDRPKLLKDVIAVISDKFNTNIKAVKISSDFDKFKGIVDLYVHSIDDLNDIRQNLTQIKGVEEVRRTLLKDDVL